MTANQIMAAIDDKRRQAGLSIEQLAVRAGKSASTVQKWMAGETLPRMDNLLAVMNVLGLSIAYTVQDKSNPCARCAERRYCENRCSLRMAYDASWIVERCSE